MKMVNRPARQGLPKLSLSPSEAIARFHQAKRFNARGGREGFGLIEIVVVAGIVVAALAGLAQASIFGVRALAREGQRLEAALFAREALEIARLLRDESWDANIAPLQNNVAYYPIVENNKWKLSGASPGAIQGTYQRSIIFNQVFRDSQDRIAAGGALDANTKKVTGRVTWGNESVEAHTYLTNFRSALAEPTETVRVSYEAPVTDADLANFPSDNQGDGDPTQSFTAPAQAISATRIDLLLRRGRDAPSDIFAELRTSPTGALLGVSNLVNAKTIATTSAAWIEFRFQKAVGLAASTQYTIRLRSNPSSNDAGSGSAGRINWIHQQSPSSPYALGAARRWVGRFSNPNDQGQALDEYDFGFRIYAVQ